MGIVGESGSGKSVTSLAVLGLLPKTAQISGSVKFRGDELIGLTEDEYAKYRGNKIAMIFQDPLTSLNPVYTVGYQISEAILAHNDISKKAALDRAIDLLDKVGIPHPQQRVHNYPHEMSGGMRQRVVIAIAMANNPDVIIADEPTTALDVTVQAQVLEALEAARAETGAALVLITHDLGVIAGHADRICVMYAGKLVEKGSIEDVFYRPRMPYTLGLLGSLPRLDETGRERLTPIVGAPPSLLNLPPGCPFTPRCPLAQDRCEDERAGAGRHRQRARTSPPATTRTSSSASPPLTCSSQPPRTWKASRTWRPSYDEHELVEAVGDTPVAPEPARSRWSRCSNLVKHFPVQSKGLIRRRIGDVHAVCDISFDLFQHETLGLVGESGCGKSTTGRLMLNLIKATSGSVHLQGQGPDQDLQQRDAAAAAGPADRVPGPVRVAGPAHVDQRDHRRAAADPRSVRATAAARRFASCCVPSA